MLFIIFHAQFFSPYQMVCCICIATQTLFFPSVRVKSNIQIEMHFTGNRLYTSKQSGAKENVKAFQTDERQWAVADLRMHLHMFLDEPIETQFTAKMETARTFVCDVRLK